MHHLLLVLQMETFIVMSRFRFMGHWGPQPSDTGITQLRPFFTFTGLPTNPGKPWNTLDFICPWNNTLEHPEIASHRWKIMFWIRFSVYRFRVESAIFSYHSVNSAIVLYNLINSSMVCTQWQPGRGVGFCGHLAKRFEGVPEKGKEPWSQ